MTDFSSLPALHRATSLKRGRNVAIRVPRWGQYVDYTWNEYRQSADQIAAGLIQVGLQAGERVAIFSENRYEWLLADQGIFSAAGVTVPLHVSLSAQQVFWQLEHCEAAWLFVSHRQLLERVLPFTSQFTHLRGVVLIEPELLKPHDGFHQLQVLSWGQVQRLGRDGLAEEPNLVSKREESLTAECLATIVYTSGTTGDPKGVMLSHGNLVSNAVNRQRVACYQSDDVKLSWLPYSHAYARTVDCFMSAYVGMTVVLAQSPATLREDLLTAQSTWMTGVPRFYEKVWREVQPLTLPDRKLKLREIFGHRIRSVSCGGAAIRNEIVEGFWEAGLPLLVGYGLTETSPVMTLNTKEAHRVGTVGKPILGVELKISDEGEVLTRGPQVMQGYWKNAEATDEVMDEGWFRTGDLGEMDRDGFLSITGRKKELIVTSQGKNVSPGNVEQRLISDQAIDQVVICGDARPYLTAIVVPDYSFLKKELGRDILAELGPTNSEFCEDGELIIFLKMRISNCLEILSHEEQVQKIVVLNRPFSIEKGELTPSLKVRRQAILAKFQAEFDSLYE